MWAVSSPKKSKRFPASATPTRSLLSGLFSAAFICLGASSALAADAAESVPLGFSADGKYFAFEQFGVQDGSGFPYSDIFVIDLEANSWVAGAPIRVLLEDEAATPGAAHAKALAEADPLLTKHRITEPAIVLAATPATEVQDDRTTVTFDPYYRHMGGSAPQPTADLWAARYTLKVINTEADPMPEHCKDYGETVMALTVTLTDIKTGAEHVVYKDTDVPKSRGCPTHYDIDKVVAPAIENQQIQLVALVGVYRMGFEGRDRRYIAIPARPE